MFILECLADVNNATTICEELKPMTKNIQKILSQLIEHVPVIRKQSAEILDRLKTVTSNLPKEDTSLCEKTQVTKGDLEREFNLFSFCIHRNSVYALLVSWQH